MRVHEDVCRQLPRLRSHLQLEPLRQERAQHRHQRIRAGRRRVGPGVDVETLHRRPFRRVDQLRIVQSDDVGRSLSRDRKRKATKKAKRGQGDRGGSLKRFGRTLALPLQDHSGDRIKRLRYGT